MKTRTSRAARELFLLTAIAGCVSHPEIPSVRFANAPPVELVNDRRDVPTPPLQSRFVNALYQFDGSFYSPLQRGLAVKRPRRALGTNALDEVPDSTWFTNRVGSRELTADEVHAGPTRAGSPEPHKPWTIVSTKTGGTSPGFVIADARGERYLLKFDEFDYPEIETATAAITNRLLWAAGYNVPEDFVVFLRPEELVLGPDSKLIDKYGKKSRLQRGYVDTRLASTGRAPDGRIRGIASRIIDGRILGGYSGTGVRESDPNDRIPHELRRDLRGAYPIFAWLDHTDIKESNTIDTWTTDPADPRRHYVVHYLIDFGKALGAMARIQQDKRRGHQYAFDLAEMIETIVTVAVPGRSWEGRSAPVLPGVGLFAVADYEPGNWRAYTPSYFPIVAADRVDKLWGAKIVAAFTPDQIRAAVAAGRLSDPRAAEYITRVLIVRQRATAKYWFERTNPLDRFTVAPAGPSYALCFDDLLLTHHLTSDPGETSYVTTTRDRASRVIGRPVVIAASPTGHTCTPIALAGDRDGYTIVRIVTARGSTKLATLVHLARDPVTRAPRVVGIWRM